MSSRFRNSLVALALMAALFGCELGALRQEQLGAGCAEDDETGRERTVDH